MIPMSLGVITERIDVRIGEHLALLFAVIEDRARRLNDDGTARTKLTSHLVNKCIEATDVSIVNTEFPALSKLHLDEHLMMRIKVVKHLTHELVIQSAIMKTVEYRGYDIVKDIFKALTKDGGEMLLPDDYRRRVKMMDQLERDRAICDFIAGMTDRYAIEFHERLYSANAQTIFKPL